MTLDNLINIARDNGNWRPYWFVNGFDKCASRGSHLPHAIRWTLDFMGTKPVHTMTCVFCKKAMSI